MVVGNGELRDERSMIRQTESSIAEFVGTKANDFTPKGLIAGQIRGLTTIMTLYALSTLHHNAQASNLCGFNNYNC